MKKWSVEETKDKRIGKISYVYLNKIEYIGINNNMNKK